MLRLSWTQPEDLVPHALVAARDEGRGVVPLERRWVDAGGTPVAAVSGASAVPASAGLRRLARDLLDEIDALPLPPALAGAEPDGLKAIEAAAAGRAPHARLLPPPPVAELTDRVHGAWLGRAAGCLLGKPVEKIPREGIRAILESTGRWPLDGYFTEVGLAADVAARYPWNRRSRPTSLAENISGMPEDDDLNFPLIALDVLQTAGPSFTTDDVAASWLANLPGGRVFTAERITYRNLLDGYEPEVAGGVRNPFRDWIGAQIRSDVYGWVSAGDPVGAARLAFRDARLSHSRNGLYGALFVAAACAASLVCTNVDAVVDAGLSVVPPSSRYARAIRRGREIALMPVDDEAALDLLYAEFGHHHWVHVLNNSALLAFALVRSEGDFERAITLGVTGGWDTDSVGATAGSVTGAHAGASRLPDRWIAPLQNRLASSVPGYDGIGFDELARRTVALGRGAALRRGAA